jgi:hypothetical protein
MAISALLFKVLVRGRASCASAERVVIASAGRAERLQELCMLAGRRAAQNERRLV